jgi:acetolactate synthase-1/2/3 large subunit
LVRDVEDLEHTLREAFRVANSDRRGPVLVDIPRDIQQAECEYEGSPPETGDGRTFLFDITQAIQAIKDCKKPYIYSGGGVLASGAEVELRSLSERLSAPVGFSMLGLTALPHDYALNLGMCGMHGKYAATVAQSECDLMIALGVRFSDRATGNIEVYREGRFIIHVDIDLAEIGKNVPSHNDIRGDVKAVLSDLLIALPPMKNEQWLSRIEELKQVDKTPQNGDFVPHNIIEMVGGSFDEDTIIATDVGQHQMWTMQHYPFGNPRTLLTSGGLGTMGYGLGAAIGGCIATGKKRTIHFTSDGSFGMNLIELATAVSQELPIVTVILNNGVLGMVRQWQTMFYGERYSQTTLNRKTDFAALAKAFGANGYCVENLSQLKTVLNNLPESGPVVIDCHIDMDEKVLPMIPPGGSVKNIIIKG